MLTLATYNLYKGGPEDYSAWARTIDALDPDILLFQESCEPSKYLGKLTPGYRSQAERAIWAQATKNYWGSAIVLKDGTANALPLPAELHGWVVGAEVQGLPWQPENGRSLRVFSLHTPTGDPCDYEGDLNVALDAIAPLAAGHDVIIGGDFNVTISVRHEAKERENTPGEIAIHRRLRKEFGLVNCWQALKPNMTLPQTLRHQFREDSPCFHLDGLFVPATWLRHLEDCRVLNGPEWWAEGCSDHFPVVATFAP